MLNQPWAARDCITYHGDLSHQFFPLLFEYSRGGRPGFRTWCHGHFRCGVQSIYVKVVMTKRKVWGERIDCRPPQLYCFGVIRTLKARYPFENTQPSCGAWIIVGLGPACPDWAWRKQRRVFSASCSVTALYPACLFFHLISSSAVNTSTYYVLGLVLLIWGVYVLLAMFLFYELRLLAFKDATSLTSYILLLLACVATYTPQLSGTKSGALALV